jgi:hypothetical protein
MARLSGAVICACSARGKMMIMKARYLDTPDKRIYSLK